MTGLPLQLSEVSLDTGSRSYEVKQKQTVAAEKARLRKATKEFESFFILQMLKAMRSTIPESSMAGGGLGKEIYTSMFDQELARRMAGRSNESIAEVLYRNLVKYIDSEDPEAVPSKPVQESKSSFDVTDDIRESKTGSGEKANREIGGFSLELRAKEIQSPVRGSGRTVSDPVLTDFGEIILDAASRYEVDPRLIHAVIMTESGGNPQAVSPKGAKGLMQLGDATAIELGVSDSLDARQNVNGGTKYLRRLLDLYKGNVKLALAAYNAGPGAVSKHNGVPPFAETRAYVDKVLALLHSR
jgi:Rod binding domain-containing protein